jgi:hypothetical protein
MSEHVFKLNYRRHPGQTEVMQAFLGSKADIYILDAARGFGKSILAVCDMVIPKMVRRPHTQIMWVAPTYKICKAPIDDVWLGVDEKTGERFVPDTTPDGLRLWEFGKSDMEIKMFNGSTLYCRSAENANSIVAKGFSLIIVDEAALIPEDVFLLQILATARKTGCKIVLISTPRGKNWFYKLFRKGQNPLFPEYKSIWMPWWKRPDYPAVLRRLMKTVPEHIRRQEFEAQFIGEGGMVFKNLDRVFCGAPIAFQNQDQEWLARINKDQINADIWVVSADLAKETDFTVIKAMGINSRRVAYYYRRNKEDYRNIVEHIRRTAVHFNEADVIYDSTGLGNAVGDFLSRDLNAYPYTFTNESKAEVINKLILGCEYKDLQIPNIMTVRGEFEDFTYSLTKTGKLSYHATDGKHDDTVISAGLAYWYAKENEGGGVTKDVDDFLNQVESVRQPMSELDRLMAEDD